MLNRSKNKYKCHNRVKCKTTSSLAEILYKIDFKV